MCQHVAGRSLVAKADLPPEVQRVIQEFADDLGDAYDPFRQDLVSAVRAGRIDLSSLESIRAEVEPIASRYSADVLTVFRDQTQSGAKAGRAVAGRRFSLDVNFERVPASVLEEFDTWSEEMVGEVLDTITEDTTRFIRAAQEEGLPIDDIAETINDDLFDGRLQDWQAKRTARTATISSSNAGSHSAYEDADSVVGEEWLATEDGRTRDTHLEADGQVVPVGGTFLVGGAEGRYPGDPQLPVGEIANCRCRPIPRFADQFSDDELSELESGGRIWS